MERLVCGAFGIAIVTALATVSLFAQAPPRSHGGRQVLWAPPSIDLPDEHPDSSVPREMVGRVQVGAKTIVLNGTSRVAAQKALGGTVGTRGDAGDWEAWLCYYGQNSVGRWILWLSSSEVDNENIDGIQWMSLSPGQNPDRRCKLIPGDKPVELPIAIRPGDSESSVRQVLGKPTLAAGNLLEYSHEHHKIINKLDFTVTNDVNVVLEAGKVRTIQVWRSAIN
jgi:hypothetical protein